MIYVDYRKSTIGQRAVASFGSMIGGAIVVLLGILGEFFEYDSLVKNGYSLVTIVCYAVVMFSGLLVLARVKYAVLIAVAAELIEMMFYITVQVSTTPNVGFLLLVKVAVILCSTQLMVKIVSFDETPHSPSPARRQGALPPQGRQSVQNRQYPQNCNRR